jgi:DNA-binding XRE family transcriptional regulator
MRRLRRRRIGRRLTPPYTPAANVDILVCGGGCGARRRFFRRGGGSMTREQFGARLAAARIEAELTQTAAAARLGIPQPRIAEYESGRKLPSLMMLFRMIDVLKLDAAILFNADRPGSKTRPARRRRIGK